MNIKKIFTLKFILLFIILLLIGIAGYSIYLNFTLQEKLKAVETAKYELPVEEKLTFNQDRNNIVFKSKWENGRIFFSVTFGSEYYSKTERINYDQRDYYTTFGLEDKEGFSLKEIKVSRSDLIRQKESKKYYYKSSQPMSKELYKNIDYVSTVSNYLFK